MEAALCLSMTRLLVLSLALSMLFGPGPVAADDDLPATSANGEAWSYEVRAQLFSPSYRWSKISPPSPITRAAERSLYLSPGLGFRAIADEGHAILVDGDYRLDFDVDGISDEDEFRIVFGVAHVGYGYRYVAGRAGPPRPLRTWTITPHVSLAAGAARKQKREDLSDIPRRSPVVGARVGVDFDLRVEEFFVGWTLSYEALLHTRGGLQWSHFLAWNAIPIFRMGFSFGHSVERRASSAARDD